MNSNIWKLILVTGVFTYLIVLMGKNLKLRNEAVNSIRSLEESVKTAGRERVKLQKQIDEAKTVEFVEQQARDTLNMVKEGETVLIMPENLPKVVENQE